jgi:hypothetical protein
MFASLVFIAGFISAKERVVGAKNVRRNKIRNLDMRERKNHETGNQSQADADIV